jgi:hypothetical protein
MVLRGEIDSRLFERGESMNKEERLEKEWNRILGKQCGRCGKYTTEEMEHWDITLTNNKTGEQRTFPVPLCSSCWEYLRELIIKYGNYEEVMKEFWKGMEDSPFVKDIVVEVSRQNPKVKDDERREGRHRKSISNT